MTELVYPDLGPIFKAADNRFAASRVVTGQEFENAASRLGRNYVGALLYDLWCAETLDLPTYPAVVASTWTLLEHPERVLDVETWVAMFAEAGYTHDGESAQRPTAPITLYRGGSAVEADPAGRGFGMSWTADLDIARQFAFGCLHGRERGVVYAAEVRPDVLLGYIHTFGRREAEFVVEAAHLGDVHLLLNNDGGVIA